MPPRSAGAVGKHLNKHERLHMTVCVCARMLVKQNSGEAPVPPVTAARGVSQQHVEPPVTWQALTLNTSRHQTLALPCQHLTSPLNATPLHRHKAVFRASDETPRSVTAGAQSHRTSHRDFQSKVTALREEWAAGCFWQWIVDSNNFWMTR